MLIYYWVTKFYSRLHKTAILRWLHYPFYSLPEGLGASFNGSDGKLSSGNFDQYLFFACWQWHIMGYNQLSGSRPISTNFNHVLCLCCCSAPGCSGPVHGGLAHGGLARSGIPCSGPARGELAQRASTWRASARSESRQHAAQRRTGQIGIFPLWFCHGHLFDFQSRKTMDRKISFLKTIRTQTITDKHFDQTSYFFLLWQSFQTQGKFLI